MARGLFLARHLFTLYYIRRALEILAKKMEILELASKEAAAAPSMVSEMLGNNLVWILYKTKNMDSL